jgi:hypothetical protein
LAKTTEAISLAESLVTGLVNSLEKLPNRPDVISSDVEADLEDWRTPLLRYLRDPNAKIDKNVQQSAFKYVLYNNELYQRTAKDLSLKCLGSDHARMAMGEVHKSICGTHKLALKMKWLLHRAGFYWPTMMVDCFCYYKGCEEYQRFENVQLEPAAMLHRIIKPWPFHGWRLDFIGQIHPPSSKGRRFVLVATDYFTK